MAWWKGKLLQDLIALASGEAVSKVAGFFAFAYLARTLGPEGYGMVELAVALAVFFAMAIDFGYSSIGAREAAKDRESADLYSRQIVSARLILTVIAIPIMGLVGVYTSQSSTSSQLIWLFSFGLFAVPWNHSWLMQGLEKMNLVALGQVIRMLVFTLGVFILVNSIDDILLVGGIELVAAASMAISYLLMQIKYVGKPRFDFQPARLIALSKKAVSVGLSNVVWTLNQYIPVILISTLNTTTQLALFAAVHRVTSSLVSFSLLYHFNLFPSVSKKINTSAAAFQELAKASTHFTAWGGCAIALFITLWSEEITVFIFGDSFKDAGKALAIIIWSLPVTLLSGHSRWALIASNRQRYVLYAQTGSSITTIIFCILLIPSHEAVGASIAMVLAAFTVWCIAYFYARKHIGTIPFFGVLVKPVLFSLTAAMLAAQIPGALMSIITAMLSYIVLTLIFDRSLLTDFALIANAKEHQQGRKIDLNMITTKRIILFSIASVCMVLGIAVPDAALANWLDPVAVDERFTSLVLGCAIFKWMLVADGVLLLYLCLRRPGMPVKVYSSMWLPTSFREPAFNTKYYAILAAIFIFAVISHSISINSGLWIDEVFTLVNYVRLDLGQILSNFYDDNQHMLYSALAQISVNYFGETAFAVRLPALLFGLGSILAIASLSRYVFGDKEGLYAAALLAVSYHHIWYSQNARGYTILLFGSIVATECMLRGLESKKWRYWIAYAAVISMAAWAHLTAVFVALAHAIVFMGLIVIQCKKSAQQYNFWQPIAGFMLAAWFTLHIYAIAIPQMIDFFSLPTINISAPPVAWRNPLWLINEIIKNLGISIAVGWFGIVSACTVGCYGLFHCARRDFLFVCLSLAPGILAWRCYAHLRQKSVATNVL